MSSERQPVRSYQRIFRPERRIYQVEGHRLPVPGGVPLRWLGYAIGALLAVIALSGRSALLAIVIAVAVAGAGLALGGRATALSGGLVSFGAVQLAGWMLSTVDWPMRLVVLPALVATLATQVTPDGRSARRYAWSWLAAQLRPERQTLGRPLPEAGAPVDVGASLAVAGDGRGARLRRGRVSGPAAIELEVPLEVSESKLRRRNRRWVARLRPTRKSRPQRRVELDADERLEVRP